ncbi:MAG: carboxylate-amine ligase [Bacteroidota bacterium]
MNRLRLFEGYGVELEYMIVDKTTLRVMPIADELLKHELGTYGSDFENGMITWSNELVAHVIEVKCTKPEQNLTELGNAMAKNVRHINSILAQWNAQLLPTAAHPFMNPLTETKLWPHDNNEVYAIYNQIFDCRGHGWSNLQSTHLNLPFANDEEFGRLHAAIRLVLPLLPALCASSPLLDGKVTGAADSRLTFYKSNQAKIPSITGAIVPEPVYTEKDHAEVILKKIEQDIAPFNTENILDPVWVNSRGAMSRFDRGSIEIRIMDIQECPLADIAIVTLVVETLKALVHEKYAPWEEQKKADTGLLADLLQTVIHSGSKTDITDATFLQFWRLPKPMKAIAIWKHIATELVQGGNNQVARAMDHLSILFEHGNLSDRILAATGAAPTAKQIEKVYRNLAGCLQENTLFISR